jgi:5-carboxymethyl-2-hydroxymuconic-semialdehyde dehydrogenase
MDKVTPSSEVFKTNRDRAAPLLAKLKADGIGHVIDGKILPSISGESFETKSPIDGAVLAPVARGKADDIDRAATIAAQAFKDWRDISATISRCWNASIPARPIASWPRPRSAPRKTFAFSPINAPTPAMA